MPRKQRHWLATLVVCALSVALAACGGGSSKSGDAPKIADPNGTLRFGFTVAAVPLDPHTAVSSVAQTPYVFPVYDRLTELAVGRDLRPMLATKWTFSADSKQVTFTLREGVKFHDGSPVDAAAVKGSLDRALTLPNSTVKGQLAMVQSVDVVDPLTVLITANRPASDLPYILSNAVGSIISPAGINRPDLDRNPAGSGPYQVTDLRLGDRVSYERAPGYWDPRAQQVARIEIIGITDDNARLSALRSGQVDAMLSKIGQHDQAARLGKGFGLYSYPAASTYAIYLNTGRPNIDNTKVRQALNYAIDREGINTAILDGQCAPQTQPLTPAFSEGYLENPPVRYTHDPVRARQLLAEAGLPNGFDMTMLIGTNLSPQDKMASALQAQLAKIDVRLSIETFDPVQVNGLWRDGKFDSYLQSRVASATEALTLSENYLLRSRTPGPIPSGVAEAVQRAFDANLPAQERDQTLSQATGMLVSAAQDVFLCGIPVQFAYSDRVIGIDAMGQSDLHGIFDLRYVGIAAK